MRRLTGDDRENVACVRCHASPVKTGGLPPETLGGYRTSDAVGCESCHGSGEAHVAAGGGRDNIEGLGEETAHQLVAEGLVRQLPDLFDLAPEHLTPLEGFAAKSAENLVSGIRLASTVALPRFLY